MPICTYNFLLWYTSWHRLSLLFMRLNPETCNNLNNLKPHTKTLPFVRVRTPQLCCLPFQFIYFALLIYVLYCNHNFEDLKWSTHYISMGIILIAWSTLGCLRFLIATVELKIYFYSHRIYYTLFNRSLISF